MEKPVLIIYDEETFKVLLKNALNDIVFELQKGKLVPPLPETGGVELAIEVLDRSKSWIYKATKDDLIPVTRFNGTLIFNRTDLINFMKTRSSFRINIRK